MNSANLIQIMYLKKIGVCDNNIYERLSGAWNRYTLLKGERDMLKINQEKCKKCQICAKNCPIGAITVEPGADGKKVVSITDRHEAIRTAVMMAEKGDVILIAGKGHEDYQEIKGVKHHFDDREEVRNAFAE